VFGLRFGIKVWIAVVVVVCGIINVLMRIERRHKVNGSHILILSDFASSYAYFRIVITKPSSIVKSKLPVPPYEDD